MSYNKGDLVKFKSARGGWVLGRVVEKLRYVPRLKGERIAVRVTSRNNKNYPFGLVYDFTPGTIVLRKSKEA